MCKYIYIYIYVIIYIYIIIFSGETHACSRTLARGKWWLAPQIVSSQWEHPAAQKQDCTMCGFQDCHRVRFPKKPGFVLGSHHWHLKRS